MRKKLLAVLLGACTVALLAGCSSKLSNDNITINKYKGLEVDKVAETKVTDDDVEAKVQSNLSASAIVNPVTDRAVQQGDIANINYSSDFDNSSAENYDLTIGSGTLIQASGDYKGFEEQIIGHKTGETFDIQVKFPDEYKDAAVAGQVKTFSITVNSISTSTVPELTDEWVKDNSKTSKTVKEYKAEVKKSLEETNADSVQNTLKSEVLTSLLADDNVKVKKYPDGDVDDQVKEMTEYYHNMATQYNMEFADFLTQYFGMTEDNFTEQVKTTAQEAVKKNLACELIAKKKNLELSDKEYEKELIKYAEKYGYEDGDAIQKAMGDDVLKAYITQDRVTSYLVENCVQVEPSDTTDNSTKDSTTDSSTSK